MNEENDSKRKRIGEIKKLKIKCYYCDNTSVGFLKGVGLCDLHIAKPKMKPKENKKTYITSSIKKSKRTTLSVAIQKDKKKALLKYFKDNCINKSQFFDRLVGMIVSGEVKLTKEDEKNKQ